MTMIGVADENEAEEDRPSTTPPSPSPPAPPPPIAPPASPLRAPASPPPVLPISMDDDAPGWRQDKVGLRLPANTRRSIRGPPATSSPTISTCAATSATFHLQLLSPAADTGGYVTAQDGDATLYLLDANQGKRCDGFRAGDESRARPTHAVFSPSSSDSDDGSTASDVSSASEDGYLDGASGPGMQLPVNVFRQWAAKEDPHLLQYLQTTDADAYLALEEGEETRLALVDGIEAKGGHILQLTACKDDQQVVEQQDDVETLSTVVKNDDLRAACDDDLRASRDDELSAARDDEEVVEQQAGIHPMDETTCAQDQAKESIKINITETLDVEVISRKQVKSTNICGKMAVKFPPPPDVEHSMLFMVSKWSEINYTAFPRVDRELFKKIPVLSSERFPDFFELLKWRRKNGHLPLPLAVTAEAIEDPHTKEYVKGVSKYFVVISCLPTGLTDIRDVVVTIPFPSVDHIGIERKTRKHIWKSVGTHEELENSIEWKIPYIGASDKSAHMDVDAFCNDGWQEPWQFFPISIDFSYDQSIGSKVSQVVRSEDGLAVDFRQDTVARCSYTIHHPNELARRAAEAAEELLAWQLAPWAPWEDEGVEDDFVWEDEGVEDDFV